MLQSMALLDKSRSVVPHTTQTSAVILLETCLSHVYSIPGQGLPSTPGAENSSPQLILKSWTKSSRLRRQAPCFTQSKGVWSTLDLIRGLAPIENDVR